MFEFLGTSQIVHLIENFMHKWHEIDEHEELRRKKLNLEHDARMKQLRESAGPVIAARREQLRKKYREEQQGPNADDADMVAKTSPTISDISESVELERNQILQAMKSAEDRFVHWPEPGQPGVSRYAMREHAERLGLENWQPGVGF